jgi:hypothetical protein
MDATMIRDAPSVSEATGSVIATSGDTVRVWTGNMTLDAKRAFSCLVAPEEGDRVLLARAGESGHFVIAVLERPDGGCVRIVPEGDIAFDVRSGRLSVSAAEGIDLVSAGTLSFSADRVDARAREGNLVLGKVRLIARAVDAVLERLYQSTRRSFRTVQEVDHLRAGQIDHAANGLARLHGEFTLVTARELVKTEGKQIHLG